MKEAIGVRFDYKVVDFRAFVEWVAAPTEASRDIGLSRILYGADAIFGGIQLDEDAK